MRRSGYNYCRVWGVGEKFSEPDPIDTYIDLARSAQCNEQTQQTEWILAILRARDEGREGPHDTHADTPGPRASVPAPKEGQAGPPSRSLQGEAGLSPAPHDGRRRHLPRHRGGPAEHADALGRRAGPRPQPWSGTPRPSPKSGWSIYWPRRPASAWMRSGTRPARWRPTAAAWRRPGTGWWRGPRRSATSS